MKELKKLTVSLLVVVFVLLVLFSCKSKDEEEKSENTNDQTTESNTGIGGDNSDTNCCEATHEELSNVLLNLDQGAIVNMDYLVTKDSNGKLYSEYVSGMEAHAGIEKVVGSFSNKKIFRRIQT